MVSPIETAVDSRRYLRGDLRKTCYSRPFSIMDRDHGDVVISPARPLGMSNTTLSIHNACPQSARSGVKMP